MTQTIKQVFGVGVLSLMIASLVMFQVGCTSTQISTAESLTQVLIQDVPQILTLLQGFGVLTVSQNTTAQAAFGQAAADYALVKTLIADFQAAPSATTSAKINAAITDAQTNLQGILTAFHVSNPQSEAQLSALINLAINTGEQIAGLFPATATTTSVRKAMSVKLPNPKSVDQQFKNLL